MELYLYHGSDHIIEQPVFGKGSSHNDYGRGFYCTEVMELAKEWACRSQSDGYANSYSLDTNGLKILDLNSDEYSILNWLAILADNRSYWQSGSISSEAKDYIRENFLIDLSPYDVIRGYRADDSYFTFAQDFVSGTISLRKLSEAMHLGKLGEQVVLKSEKAFDALHYIESIRADGNIYYSLKLSRDKTARRAYRANKSMNNYENDVFILDIMREGITNGDPRIR